MESRPKFRSDLEVFDNEDIGYARGVVLKDPLSEKFYRLSLYEYRLLKTLDGAVDVGGALEKLRAAGYYYSPEDARLIVSKAAELGMVLGTRFGTAQFQGHLKERIRAAKRSARFAGIYFLYIPLVNPDRFLESTLWIFRKFVNRWTGALLLLLVPGAAYMVVAGIGRIEREYLFFFNVENLLYLWITIALTKLAHEFAHAYTAKSFGLHVPQMGVAFLIFFPCLYCNTTDAWQLADRKQRMAIGAAGIVAEAAVAIIAAYLWYFSRPGILNSLAYYLMAVSFLSTILFNGNPLMKFDGYFMLTDFLGITNLATKSFGYIRYLFMNRVLGISLVANPAATPRDVMIFFSYGIAALAYRFFLYTGIVMGVYYRFNKLVGIMLAFLAMAMFIVRPVVRGVKSIFDKRAEINLRFSGAVVFSLLGTILVVPLLIPVSTKSVYPCYLASSRTQKLTVPLRTSVTKVFIRDGAAVRERMLLFQLDPTQLKVALTKKAIDGEILKRQLQLLLLDDNDKAKAAEKLVEFYQLQHDIQMLKKDLDTAQSGIIAPFDGIITKLDYRLRDGFQPGEGVVVGELQSETDREIRMLIPEDDVHKLRTGQPVEIWLPAGTGRLFSAKIESIKPYSETDLRDSPFSSRLGGEVATEARDDAHLDAPLKAQYVCTTRFPINDPMPIGLTGRGAVGSPPQSMLSRLFRAAVQTLNRESIL